MGEAAIPSSQLFCEPKTTPFENLKKKSPPNQKVGMHAGLRSDEAYLEAQGLIPRTTRINNKSGISSWSKRTIQIILGELVGLK